MANGEEYAGTQPLVAILAQVSQLYMQFPDNPKIAKLYEAATEVMDPTLCQAILLENSRLQQEQAQTRQSPLAQIMAGKAWTPKN